MKTQLEAQQFIKDMKKTSTSDCMNRINEFKTYLTSTAVEQETKQFIALSLLDIFKHYFIDETTILEKNIVLSSNNEKKIFKNLKAYIEKDAKLDEKQSYEISRQLRIILTRYEKCIKPNDIDSLLPTEFKDTITQIKDHISTFETRYKRAQDLHLKVALQMLKDYCNRLQQTPPTIDLDEVLMMLDQGSDPKDILAKNPEFMAHVKTVLSLAVKTKAPGIHHVNGILSGYYGIPEIKEDLDKDYTKNIEAFYIQAQPVIENLKDMPQQPFIPDPKSNPKQIAKPEFNVIAGCIYGLTIFGSISGSIKFAPKLVSIASSLVPNITKKQAFCINFAFAFIAINLLGNTLKHFQETATEAVKHQDYNNSRNKIVSKLQNTVGTDFLYNYR